VTPVGQTPPPVAVTAFDATDRVRATVAGAVGSTPTPGRDDVSDCSLREKRSASTTPPTTSTVLVITKTITPSFPWAGSGATLLAVARGG
jgi:hypothetical protein